MVVGAVELACVACPLTSTIREVPLGFALGLYGAPLGILSRGIVSLVRRGRSHWPFSLIRFHSFF